MNQEIIKLERQEFQDLRREYKELVKTTTINMPVGPVKLSANKWSEVPGLNIKTRLCSLTGETGACTIANVVFNEGGFIPKHQHEQKETIFCLAGEYYDAINGVLLQEGDIQVIPAKTPHSGQSDYCLLTVTWQPAIPEDEQN